MSVFADDFHHFSAESMHLPMTTIIHGFSTSAMMDVVDR